MSVKAVQFLNIVSSFLSVEINSYLLSFKIKVFRRFASVLEGFRLCKVRDLVQKRTALIKNWEMIPVRFRQPVSTAK